MRARGAVAACFATLLSTSFVRADAPPGPDAAGSQVLWHDAPARDWERHTFFQGNGRIGCAVFGGVAREEVQFNVDSLWTGDANPSGKYGTMGSYQNFGSVVVELAGATPDAPRLSCSSGHKPYQRGQQTIAESVDGNVDTKWCIIHKGRPLVWQVELPAEAAVTVREYALTAAEDVPDRDPTEWKLEGSNDGKAWTILDHRRDEPRFERHQRKTFSCANTTAFRFYRLTLLKNHGNTHYQLSEIELAGVEFGSAAGADGYRRELDLATAVHRVRYSAGGVRFERETFASRPDEVVVSSWTAEAPGSYSGRVTIEDAHGATPRAVRDRLVCSGELANGLHYEAQILLRHRGGTVRADGDALVFEKCDSLRLFLAADTDYAMDLASSWRGEHPHERLSAQLNAAAAKTHDALIERHVADHAALFGRVMLDVGKTAADRARLPLDKRLEAYGKGEADPDLEELFTQFGRYLLIGSSRPGTLPANLQGIWNHRNNPPWHSDYHADINIQMCYWLAETTNLGECFEPFVSLMDAIRAPAREATRQEYGDVRGFTYRYSHNIFGGLGWRWYPPASAWYCQHLWEHYAFHGDVKYLRETAYPMMKEVCQYWEDRLKALPDGTLVSPNGWSPEHGPHEDGVAHDQQILWDLFTSTIAAAAALGADDEYREQLAAKRDRLLEPQIGSWGQLREWMITEDDPNDHHRHVSHMFAVFPGRQISPTVTPKLAAAAKKSLEARGFGTDVGWANAWKAALWARLLDRERAYMYFRRQVARNAYPNLINACWPGRVFQIDGNFGVTAAVAEMLLQSHAGDVHLLPALPERWSDGKVTGLRARGGLEVDIEWRDGKLVRAVIKRVAGRQWAGREVRVRHGDQVESRVVPFGAEVVIGGE